MRRVFLLVLPLLVLASFTSSAQAAHLPKLFSARMSLTLPQGCGIQEPSGGCATSTPGLSVLTGATHKLPCTVTYTGGAGYCEIYNLTSSGPGTGPATVNDLTGCDKFSVDYALGPVDQSDMFIGEGIVSNGEGGAFSGAINELHLEATQGRPTLTGFRWQVFLTIGFWSPTGPSMIFFNGYLNTEWSCREGAPVTTFAATLLGQASS